MNVVTNLIGDSLLGNLYGSEYDYHACDEVILISSDRDFRPALEMTARHKVPSVTYFNLGPGNVPKATHAGLVQWRKLSLEDLRACHLPDPIHLGDGSSLSWQGYLALCTRFRAAGA